MRSTPSWKRIWRALIASALLIFELPARRFSKRIGVSPKVQPAWRHQKRISYMKE
jgi:hypothetical protein